MPEEHAVFYKDEDGVEYRLTYPFFNDLMVMQSKCDAFNKRHPVGSPVTVVKDLGEMFETKVKHPAQVFSGHTPVVWVEGIGGCYLLDRVF